MQAYFLSKTDLKVKCVCMPTSWEINEDSQSAAISSVKFAKVPNAVNGDYLALKDGGSLLYLGVLSSVEGDKSTSAVEIRTLSISSIFSRNILLGEDTLNTEDYIVNAINANFVHSDDYLLDISYIEAAAITHTPLGITPYNDNGIYNLETFLRYVAKRHGIFADFIIMPDVLKVNVERRILPAKKIDLTVSDVLFLNEVITSEKVSKVIVKTASSVLTFYAFEDGSYGENPAAGVRMLSRVEAIYCENPDDALKAAGDVFSKNLYDHLIEAEISTRSKLIDTGGLRLYDEALVRTKSGVYNTYVSAISRSNADKVTIKFGDVRVTLTDKLKGG